MLSRFLKWWFAELAALFGPGPGSPARDRGQYLCLQLSDGRVQVGLRRRGHYRVLTELNVDESGHLAGLPEAVVATDPEHTRCRVVLPASLVLTRELELPLAAEENLREVLGFEMDRQTPFRASEVYFDHRILKRDTVTQKIKVCLQVARRALVDNLLTHLGHWNLKPVHSPAAPLNAGELILDFEPEVFQERSASGFNTLLTVIMLILAAVAITLPIRDLQHFRSQLETRLAAAQLTAAQAVKIRDQLDDSLLKSTVLHEAKRHRPAMTELLEEMTHILPDSTYLFRFEVRDDGVSMQGSSQSASALIEGLEQSPLLGNVRFASPVTREGNAGRERFHINARLLPRPPPQDSAGRSDLKAPKRS